MMKKFIFTVCSLLTATLLMAQVSKEVTTTAPNTLKTQLPMPVWGTITNLKINGPLGEGDILFLSNVAKATSTLSELDMSNATDLMLIGKNSFNGLKSLKSISLPASVNTIEEKAFMDCSNLSTVNFPASGLTTIGNRAFANDTLISSLTLPATLGSIDPVAFNGCSHLYEFSVAAGSSYLSAIGGVLYTKEDQTLVCYPMARTEENYSIPEGTVHIGENAFSDCKALKMIEMPASVKTIGKKSFENCSGLSNMIVGDNVTTIGDYAFSGCKGLTAVVLSYRLKTLGDGVFLNCCNITSLRCEGSIPATYSSLVNPFFSDDPTICSIKPDLCVLSVPNTGLAKYKTAEGWKSFTNIEGFQVGK